MKVHLHSVVNHSTPPNYFTGLRGWGEREREIWVTYQSPPYNHLTGMWRGGWVRFGASSTSTGGSIGCSRVARVSVLWRSHGLTRVGTRYHRNWITSGTRNPNVWRVNTNPISRGFKDHILMNSFKIRWFWSRYEQYFRVHKLHHWARSLFLAVILIFTLRHILYSRS